MKLPPLWIIIASQALVWCVAGAYVHTWKILLYPLSWLLVGGAFLWHSKMYPIESALSSGPFANSKPVAENSEAQKESVPG